MDKNTTKGLEVRLTATELAAYAQTLAIGVKDWSDLKSESKRVAKVYKDNIDEKETEIVILAKRVRTEKEIREVECRWDYDWNRNVKTLTRLDTFEQVEERVIDASERQLYLDGIKKAEEAMEPVKGEA